MLDVGGGFGVMARFLPDFVDRENRYINLDISSEMLKYSPHQNILAATEYIPFCDVSFDYVFMSDVLEHVRDKTVALKESYRVLKLGGLLLLTTPRTGWIKDFNKSYSIVFVIADWVISSIRRKLVFNSVPKSLYTCTVTAAVQLEGFRRTTVLVHNKFSKTCGKYRLFCARVRAF